MSVEELIKKKELKIKTEEEKKKMLLLKELVSVDDWMFINDLEVIVGILDFLEVPEQEIKDYYLSLISPENFMKKHPTERL